MVDHLGGHRRGVGLVEAADLADDAAALGDHVDRRAALDRSDVRGRLIVDAPEPHCRDRARCRDDRRAARLGPDSGVRRAAVQISDHPVVRRGGDDDLADRRRVVEHVAERALKT